MPDLSPTMHPFVRPRPVEHPRVRLVVFHHAGGSASSYFPLVHGMPDDWDLLLLDLPGRGKRHRSAPLPDMSTVIATAADDVSAWSDCPLALFGHSMGGIIAVEVARLLERRATAPVWLGVSGRIAPNQPVRFGASLHELPDEGLMSALTAMGGMSARMNELPDGHRGRLLELVRHDLRLVERYRPDPARASLDVPITAFVGAQDVWTPSSSTADWALETSGNFRQRIFHGGHFYFVGQAFTDLSRAIVAEVHRCLPRAAEPEFKATQKLAS
jgi:surfactin synthase thioesterase subunit